MPSETIRWGIIGSGNIARQFARGLAVLPDAALVAVGSRSQGAADAFGELFGVPRRHASYDALANDPDVDAVYIATPHVLHKENSLLCLRAGKAVLCEKPFTINAREAEDLIAYARGAGLLLMEAMWTRFLPIIVRLRQLLAEGAIGEVRMLSADFGFRAKADPASRLFNPALGGGALLDVGIYPVSLASMVFGAPARVTGMAHLGETGVDEQAAIILGYDGGRLAQLSTAIRTSTPHEALLMGTEGQIKIETPWWMPTRMTVHQAGKAPELIELPFTGNGYNYEAAEVMRCLREGQRESPIMPLDETLTIMQTLDTIRGQWGLRYPGES
jgi:predicted dehydrogenase